MRPRLLILDEPTSELDPAGRAEIFELITRLASRGGYAVLVVEHALDELAVAVERLLIMDKGRIVFDDSPGRVLRHMDDLVRIGVRPPDATVLGLAAERAGMIPVQELAFMSDDSLLAELPQ